MVKKLNRERASKLAYGDFIACRKKIEYYGDVCFKKGGVYKVLQSDVDKLIVEDELGEQFNVNGLIDYTKYFYRVSKNQTKFSEGDFLLNIKKIKGIHKGRFKKGKPYKVIAVDLEGKPYVITEKGTRFKVTGTKDFSNHFVKVY